MKLVLCSEGFHTQNTVDKCVELVGKPKEKISVAIINEAYAVEKGDKRWVLRNMQSVFDNFPGEVDIVDLLALQIEEVEQRLEDKDVIFVIGGNSDYLMSVFEKTGFSVLLPKLLETRVYVGSSAGSMVIGKRINEDAHKFIYGERSDYDITEFMNLVDFSILPHLLSAEFEGRKEAMLTAVGNYKGKIYGLNDDSAVVVDGDDEYVIGSEPVIIDESIH